MINIDIDTARKALKLDVGRMNFDILNNVSEAERAREREIAEREKIQYPA